VLGRAPNLYPLGRKRKLAVAEGRLPVRAKEPNGAGDSSEPRPAGDVCGGGGGGVAELERERPASGSGIQILPAKTTELEWERPASNRARESQGTRPRVEIDATISLQIAVARVWNSAIP
jgi:hypothetical protein